MAQGSKDDTSVDIAALEQTIKDNGGGSLLSVQSYIFRVPEVLRRNNTMAYQPDMVAIGPSHNRNQKQYQHMEKVKWWYLHNYIRTSKNVDLAKLIEVVKQNEKDARDCYAESLDIKPNKFIEMMILDGCFLVELFRKFTYKKRKHIDDSRPREDDPILSMDCMIQYICHDILLLENQLPWVVLQCLYNETKGNLDRPHKSLSVLILDAFSFLPSVGNHCKAYLDHLLSPGSHNANHKHVLDLVRTSIVYSFEAPSHEVETKCLQWAKQDGIDIRTVIPPATTLSKGGVKFKKGFHRGESIMSMGFEHGELRIPQLVIGELTETLFRNLIAFEQCSQGHSYEITSYAVLMNKLISSKEDMEFLCEKDIIRNWLSAEDGFKFFNKIHNDTFPDKFHYYVLCISVKRYCNVKYFRWMAILWRKYFDTPWTIISLIAAIILLVLTLVQTIFTVLDSGIVFFMQ